MISRPFPFHDHGEVVGDDAALDADERWNPDDIALTTVGIDIGSSTSHLMFSRLHLRRLGRTMSSRYVVVSRESLARSPIVFTPYEAEGTIDATRLGSLVQRAFAAAGVTRSDIDTGAVILTGVAIERANARAIAELFAADAGRFVCAAAGHRLEAILAAHGSGAVEESRDGDRVVLHVDIGGGTSKLALVRGGRILDVAAIAVGARLLAFDDLGRLTRIEAAAHTVADHAGLELRLGEVMTLAARELFVEVLVSALREAMAGGPAGALAAQLMLTEPLPAGQQPQLVTFSGGVAEYIYKKEERDFGDLGPALGARLASGAGGHPSAERIRATVMGASQFTVQVSGDTLWLSRPGLLPIRNLPVVSAPVPETAELEAYAVAASVRAGFERLDLEEGVQPVAVAVDWQGQPSYRNLRVLAEGIRQGLTRSLEAGLPLVLIFSQDVARLVGELLQRELAVTGDVVAIDSVELRELDFIDIGDLLVGRRVVPVVVKSLVFGDTARSPERMPALRID